MEEPDTETSKKIPFFSEKFPIFSEKFPFFRSVSGVFPAFFRKNAGEPKKLRKHFPKKRAESFKFPSLL